MKVTISLALAVLGWACLIDAKRNIRAQWDAYDDPDATSFAAYTADRKRSQ